MLVDSLFMQTLTKYRAWLIAVVAILVASLLDSWAWHHLAKPGIYDADLGRMFRIVGYLPIWLLIAIGFWLQTRDNRRALLLGLVPTLGGLICEVLKILSRRERPNLHDGQYYFRPVAEMFRSTRDIGLPSSHAMVAFSAAWLLCRLWPKGWPIWLLLAGGCALTRVESQAHFLSDVTVGAVAAYAVVAIVWRKTSREKMVPGGVRP